MAGVDYDLTARLKLELSYRYLSYGTGATGGADAYLGLAGPISSATDWPRTTSGWASST